MISSRGLHWSGQALGLSRQRIGVNSTRQFSSFNVQYRQTRATPLLSSIASSSFKTLPRIQSNNTFQVIRNGAGVRFASTAPAAISSIPPVATVTPDVAATSSSAIPTSLDSFSEVDLSTITHMPEQIGYLKALGLEYGYGPTAIMEWAFEHTHIYAGTPWWISIALTMGIIRVAMFYPSVVAARNNAKLIAIKPRLDPLNEKLRNAARDGDPVASTEIRREMSLLYKSADVSRWKMMTPLIQPILGFGSFWILRAMAHLPVPALVTGGTLWFHNLTIPDPYFILPIATALSTHWLFRMGGENGQMVASALMQRFMMYGLPVISLLFTWWLPAAVQLSFFAGAVMSFFQAIIFRSKSMRTLLRLPPIASPVVARSSPLRSDIRLASSSTPAPVRTIAARPRALSTSELNSRFQPTTHQQPTESATVAPSSLKSSIAEKLKDQFSGVEEFRRDMIKSGKQKMDDRMVKATQREKEQYEKKRADEVKEARIMEQQRRRAERAARKH